MGILKSELSWIVVSDLKKAKKFFTETLGLQLHGESHEYGWLELSGKEGGATIGVAQADEHSPVAAGGNAVITFTVDNLEKTKQEFIKNGVTCVGDILEVPGHVKMQTFKDDDGNYFQLCQKIQ